MTNSLRAAGLIWTSTPDLAQLGLIDFEGMDVG